MPGTIYRLQDSWKIKLEDSFNRQKNRSCFVSENQPLKVPENAKMGSLRIFQTSLKACRERGIVYFVRKRTKKDKREGLSR